MSLIRLNWGSLKSYLERRSLNSSIGRFIMSSTDIGTFNARARFSSRVKCSSSLFRPLTGIINYK